MTMDSGDGPVAAPVELLAPPAPPVAPPIPAVVWFPLAPAVTVPLVAPPPLEAEAVVAPLVRVSPVLLAPVAAVATLVEPVPPALAVWVPAALVECVASVPPVAVPSPPLSVPDLTVWSEEQPKLPTNKRIEARWRVSLQGILPHLEALCPRRPRCCCGPFTTDVVKEHAKVPVPEERA
jgi:hypothetical protein